VVFSVHQNQRILSTVLRQALPARSEPSRPMRYGVVPPKAGILLALLAFEALNCLDEFGNQPFEVDKALGNGHYSRDSADVGKLLGLRALCRRFHARTRLTIRRSGAREACFQPSFASARRQVTVAGYRAVPSPRFRHEIIFNSHAALFSASPRPVLLLVCRKQMVELLINSQPFGVRQWAALLL
jgi:hypothetical protein